MKTKRKRISVGIPIMQHKQLQWLVANRKNVPTLVAYVVLLIEREFKTRKQKKQKKP